MIRKFDEENFSWDGVERHIYKDNEAVFRNVTKQILFENEGDLPVQFRYFEVAPGGWSSFEHHAHMHMVVIFRGSGHALIGKKICEVKKGDLITIPGWDWHQFRADCGETLGFFCLVRAERDAPVYPTEEEIEELKRDPEIAKFLSVDARMR